MDTQEHAAVHMCSFGSVQRSNYFGEELIKITELGVRVGNLRNEKAVVIDEFTE